MNVTNQIETKRLILRSTNQDDFEFILEIFEVNDIAENLKFFLKNKPEKDKKTLIRSIIASHNTSGPMVALIIINKESNNLIGICGLIPLESSNEVECFYALLPRYRGQGFAIESMKKLIEYAFTKLNLAKIIAFINPKSASLWKVAERIGMKYMGQIQYNNITSMAMFFTIEKSEYEIQRFY